ncbi:MAG TPA: efflux RND transporter permease subunit, partial [Planctomycetaceae bacterium]
LPLFTMKGPEGQIFGPMADTYAFALAGALLLAFTISPVLCGMLFGNLKESGDNFIVRGVKFVYMAQLRALLANRWATVGVFAILVFSTVYIARYMGREFMPELEEGNVVIRGTFPVNVSLEEVTRNARFVRQRLATYPEIKLAASQIGRPDDGTDPTGFFELQLFVPLNPRSKWPDAPGKTVPRQKFELIEDLDEELSHHVPGVNWDFSQIIRDNVMESLSGVKGENSVKIIGPDLDKLEKLAVEFRNMLSNVSGVSDPGIFRIKGQSNLSFPIDRGKCALWGVNVADVEDVIETAVGGMPFTEMLEGERRFDIALRWPEELRKSADDILDIPVDVVRNTVTEGNVLGRPATPVTGATTGLSALGTGLTMPALTGSSFNASANNLSRVPRRRLGDLVTPVDEHGDPDPNGEFVKPGAATISREQGQRLIAVKFGVRGRDLASTVAEAQKRTAPLLSPPYRSTWSGEFQQMQEAEHRMLLVVSLALVLIMIMLYLAFYSALDALLVLANVLAMSLGGLWTLLLAGLHFNVSAAVGFISILGVAVMEGMILVSSFNSLRSLRVPVFDAILKGTERRIRPVTMTALTAILGLLPAAFSTKIGSESQRPLAIVVVGGMIGTLLFFNLVPVLYSFYGHREPHADLSSHAH